MTLVSSLLPLVASRLLPPLLSQNHHSLKMYTILINHRRTLLAIAPCLSPCHLFHQKFYRIAPLTTTVAITHSEFTDHIHESLSLFLLSFMSSFSSTTSHHSSAWSRAHVDRVLIRNSILNTLTSDYNFSTLIRSGTPTATIL